MSTLKQKAQDILDEKDEKIVPENIKKDIQIFDVTGTLEEGIDTSDATATANDLVRNATAYVKGVKISGSIRDYRSESGITDFEDLEYSEDEPSQGKLKLLTHMGLSSPDTVISSDNIVELKIPYYELTSNIGLTANKLKKGETILGITGTLEEGTDTSDATATANDLVENTTAYVKGVKLAGAIGDSRDDTLDIIPEAASVVSHTTLSVVGHLDLPCASSSVAINNGTSIHIEEIDLTDSEITDEIGLVPQVIKRGETILGITGTLDASGIDTSDATATENDIVENTTAYVDGVKLTGNIIDRRGYSQAVSLEPTSMGDNSNTELVVNMEYVPKECHKSNVVANDKTPFYVAVQYSDIVSELNITSDMIRVGKEILGVTGTYSGNSIVYLEPGDEIHINMMGLEEALETLVDKGGFGAEPLAYDENGEDLFTLKLMDCINMGQPYNHSGIGLVMDGTTTYLKVYNWDATTDTNTVQFSSFIDLVSGDYPAALDFNMSSLLSIMNDLGGHAATDLTFVYPNNAPIIPLIESNSVGLLTKDGCDIGDVLTFNLANSYITIHKACA